MGLLSDAMGKIGGLLGTQGIPLQSFLGIPTSQRHLGLMLATGGDPEKIRQLEMDRMRQELLQRQMDAMDKQQGRQDYTTAVLQKFEAQAADAVSRLRGAIQSGDQVAAQKAREDLQQIQSPENQLLRRLEIAAKGDMGMALEAGLVAPPQPEELTAKMREYEFAKQNGYTGTFTDFLQLGAGGQASLFAPTLVRGDDGKYIAVQFGNTPGMPPVKSELGGVPSFDPGIAGQRAEATAIGTASGEATAAAPGEVAILEDAIALFSRLNEMPGLEAATGPVQGRLPTVQKATRDFEALREQAISTIALAARGQLKGTGAITENEQSQLRAAQTLLSDPTISETLARQEISRVLQWLESKKARKEQMIVPNSSSAQQPTSSGPRRRGVWNAQTGRIEYQ